MKSMKAYENGDINSCVAAFGDSVELKFDNYYAKVSNDSLKKMFTGIRNAVSAVKINMKD